MKKKSAPQKKPVGRPTKYCEKIAAEICERLSNGEPMAKICKDPRMPAYSTTFRWQDTNEKFKELSTRARRDGTHYLADECVEISDNLTIDPSHKRIMVDTRLRLIGKWNAREYGDKLDLNTTVTGEIKIIVGGDAQ